MFDRFRFEEQLISLENSSDILLVVEAFLDKGLSEDEVSNALIGIAEMQKIRFNKIFDTFEEDIEQEKIL